MLKRGKSAELNGIKCKYFLSSLRRLSFCFVVSRCVGPTTDLTYQTFQGWILRIYIFESSPSDEISWAWGPLPALPGHVGNGGPERGSDFPGTQSIRSAAERSQSLTPFLLDVHSRFHRVLFCLSRCSP